MPPLNDHPLAAVFPLMSDDELAALADDIESNGLREPIWLLDGLILDGRNRYRACRLKDIDHRVEHYKGKDPLGFVVSKNLYRRHLTSSQRAMVAAHLATARRGERKDTNGGNSPHLTRTQAADLFGVGADLVKDAKAVQARGTLELVQAVESGDVSVSAAAEVAKLPPDEQLEAIRSGTVVDRAREQREKPSAPPEPAADDTALENAAADDTLPPDEPEPGPPKGRDWVEPPGPPPNPFQDIASGAIAFSTLVTRRMNDGTEEGQRLCQYLTDNGLVEHVPEKVVNGVKQPARKVFLPLKGIVPLALEAGRTNRPRLSARESQATYQKSCGGWIPPATARRRAQKAGRGKK